MIQRLAGIDDEYRLLETSLGDPELLADPARLRVASKRYKDMTPLVEALRRHRARKIDLDATRELVNAAAGDDRELWRAELVAVEDEVAQLEDQIRTLMLPKDPHEGRAVIMEIRGAEGGEEANLFARDLFDMYQGYANREGWKFEVLSSDASGLGGLNQVTLVVRGDTAWSHLKFEGGTHRVQRVPVTESQGRIHTSSATVLAMPEADEVEFEIDERDLDVDVYRSSGAGGQSVNTTDSAVRITTDLRGSWLRCKTSAASCRTRHGQCRCYGRDWCSWPRTNTTQRCRSSVDRRSVAVDAARRSARTTSRRTASPITASASPSTAWPMCWPAI